MAAKNNNPGNLRYAGQDGAAPGQGGFARFKSAAQGFAALVNQVRLDASRGHTLQSFISKFAPPSENDTSHYIRTVATKVGASPSTPLSKLDANMVARIVAEFESGTKV